MKKFIYTVFLVFSLLGILFIPFSFRYLTFQSAITKFLFQGLILFFDSKFDKSFITNPEISSDSATFYELFFTLFILALLITLAFSFSKFGNKYHHKIVHAIQMISVFYLSLIMLKYGFDKIFKAQFYLPEPNILYTPLGMLDKDILFWSTMGTSHTYSIFMGLMEVIPALLLLYHKTRKLGLLLLSGVLLNVVFINLGFDISVKLYSLFLLMLCVLLLIPVSKNLWNIFVLGKTGTLISTQNEKPVISSIGKIGLKIVLLLFIFAETLYPYIESGQFNDDNVPKNAIHGAYSVYKITNPTNEDNNLNLKIKRFFIHRDNYLIFQYNDDTMEDFYFENGNTHNQLILSNYDGKLIPVLYTYSEKTNVLKLQFTTKNMEIYAKSIPWKELPIVQPLFHWTVDGIK